MLGLAVPLGDLADYKIPAHTLATPATKFCDCLKLKKKTCCICLIVLRKGVACYTFVKGTQWN